MHVENNNLVAFSECSDLTLSRPKMVVADDTTSPSPPKHFIDNNQPGKIMFIKQPCHGLSACFGGLMATRAKYLGAGAVVIDGFFRDVREIQEMGFPVLHAMLL